MSALRFTHQQNKHKNEHLLVRDEDLEISKPAEFCYLSPSCLFFCFFFAGCLWTSPHPSSFSKTSSTSRSRRRCSEVCSSESTPTESWPPSIKWWRASTTLTPWRRCSSRWAEPMLWGTTWTPSTLRWNGSNSNTHFSVSVYASEKELHHIWHIRQSLSMLSCFYFVNVTSRLILFSMPVSCSTALEWIFNVRIDPLLSSHLDSVCKLVETSFFFRCSWW